MLSLVEHKTSFITSGPVCNNKWEQSSSYLGCGLGGLDFQAWFRIPLGSRIFRPLVRLAHIRRALGLSIKWTGRRLMTDSGTKCAWVIHESKAVQIHVHKNRRCLYVPRVPSSVKKLRTTVAV